MSETHGTRRRRRRSPRTNFFPFASFPFVPFGHLRILPLPIPPPAIPLDVVVVVVFISITRPITTSKEEFPPPPLFWGVELEVPNMEGGGRKKRDLGTERRMNGKRGYETILLRGRGKGKNATSLPLTFSSLHEVSFWPVPKRGEREFSSSSVKKVSHLFLHRAVAMEGWMTDMTAFVSL